MHPIQLYAGGGRAYLQAWSNGAQCHSVHISELAQPYSCESTSAHPCSRNLPKLGFTPVVCETTNSDFDHNFQSIFSHRDA